MSAFDSDFFRNTKRTITTPRVASVLLGANGKISNSLKINDTKMQQLPTPFGKNKGTRRCLSI